MLPGPCWAAYLNLMEKDGHLPRMYVWVGLDYEMVSSSDHHSIVAVVMHYLVLHVLPSAAHDSLFQAPHDFTKIMVPLVNGAQSSGI